MRLNETSSVRDLRRPLSSPGEFPLESCFSLGQCLTPTRVGRRHDGRANTGMRYRYLPSFPSVSEADGQKIRRQERQPLPIASQIVIPSLDVQLQQSPRSPSFDIAQALFRLPNLVSYSVFHSPVTPASPPGTKPAKVASRAVGLGSRGRDDKIGTGQC